LIRPVRDRNARNLLRASHPAATEKGAALQIMTTEGVGRIGGSVFGDVYAVQCSRCG
jgi:hypothetical protein